MLPLSDDMVESITPELTCKEIRNMKNAVKESDNEADNEQEYIANVRIAPPISLSERRLTKDNLPIVIGLLRENIGREIQILVEDNGAVDSATDTEKSDSDKEAG